jgi:LuxR family maltose regulon positive regulatory protein
LKPDNVKYHIKENYRKLNVDNKTDALLAARSLGLL